MKTYRIDYQRFTEYFQGAQKFCWRTKIRSSPNLRKRPENQSERKSVKKTDTL